MHLSKEGYLLRIFIGESDRHEGRSLYEWIVRQAREQGLAGATVLRGMMGFGANSRVIHTFKIERLSEDLPIVIEIIDSRDKLESFLARIEGHIQAGLATLEKAEVHFYRTSSSANNSTVEKQETKKIGLIGGIGPESTIDYYRLIIDTYRSKKQDGSYPSIVVNSIDLQTLRGLIETNQLSKVASLLVKEIRTLAAAGAVLGIVAANTPHIVFEDIERESPIPLISIVEATCARAKSLGLKKPGLFGTRFTMQGHFYQKVFRRENIELILPEPEEQAYIHEKYMNELLVGIVLPETRRRLLLIAGRMKDQNGMDGLILGGTELSLILRDAPEPGIPVLDTTQIHVEAVLARILA